MTLKLFAELCSAVQLLCRRLPSYTQGNGPQGGVVNKRATKGRAQRGPFYDGVVVGEVGPPPTQQCDRGCYMQKLLLGAPQLRPDPHQHGAGLGACQRAGAENVHPARPSPTPGQQPYLVNPINRRTELDRHWRACVALGPHRRLLSAGRLLRCNVISTCVRESANCARRAGAGVSQRTRRTCQECQVYMPTQVANLSSWGHTGESSLLRTTSTLMMHIVSSARRMCSSLDAAASCDTGTGRVSERRAGDVSPERRLGLRAGLGLGLRRTLGPLRDWGAVGDGAAGCAPRRGPPHPPHTAACGSLRDTAATPGASPRPPARDVNTRALWDIPGRSHPRMHGSSSHPHRRILLAFRVCAPSLRAPL